MSEPDGRFAIVTGGGGGIGAACAAALTAAGLRVAVIGRRTAALEGTVATGAACDLAIADVTDEAATHAALATLAARHGPAGVLVNNAGAASSARFSATTPAVFRQMLDVNLMGAVHATQAVLPAMLQRGAGRVVNIASVAALRGYAYVTAYVAAKHALLGLTRALALELATTGVTVNAVCPGYTDTDLVAESVARIAGTTGRSPEQALDSLTRGNPQRRLIHPDEVARAVLFLCGAGAGGITGIAMPVAGGEAM